MNAALLRRLALGRYAGVLVALVVVCAYLAFTQEVFLTWDNFMNIAKSNSVVFVLALGATFVIISGGLDLSTASAAAAAGMILGLTMDGGWSIAVALAATAVFGLFLGLLNGFMITRLRISYLVVTLGTLSIYQSFALVVNSGRTITVFGDPGFSILSDFVNNDIGPFPILLVFDLLLLLVAGGILRYTGFGRSLFAVGSNREAARLNGIDVGRIVLLTYGIAGLAAGLASVVQVGRLTGASAQADPTLLLTVIAAVLIGGTIYTGGEGGVLGTLVGVLFLGVVQNGLTLSNVSSFWQGTVSGVILIAAVGLGVLRDRSWSVSFTNTGEHGEAVRYRVGADGRNGDCGVWQRERERGRRRRDEGRVFEPGRGAAGPAGHRVRVQWRCRGARLDAGVDRRQPVARQAGRRHRDDGDPGRGRHRQLDARPRRRRRRVQPGPGCRHPGHRRELRGDGHRRDRVVGAEPVRRRVADRGAHGVHPRAAAGREGALHRRAAGPVDPGL